MCALRATATPTKRADAWRPGAITKFIFNCWSIGDDLRAFWADPTVSQAYTRRESMFCRSCCASLRVRRIAEVLLALYGPAGCTSLAQLIQDPKFRDLEIAEINTIGSVGSLHALLQQVPPASLLGLSGSRAARRNNQRRPR